MTNSQIVKRLDAIQEQLDSLSLRLKDPSQNEWRAVAGTFADDPLFDKAMKYGADYRKSLRPKSKKRAKSR